MLSRVQLIALGILLLFPILLFAGVGMWTLWGSGWLFWLSWSIPICWGLAWLMLRVWGNPLEIPPPALEETHWTPRDDAASEIVRQEQELAKSATPEQLVDTRFYANSAQQLAERIARHYHPQAKDPLGNLTVLEVLTATELVAEDLETWFQQHVPGSHLITISQWKLLSNAPQWWQVASNAGWVASILLNPVNIGRYFVSKLAVDPLSRQLQGSLLTAFYLLYIRQVGYYLIEMNSGRLRGGAVKYREMMRRLAPVVREAASVVDDEKTSMPSSVVEVTIAVIGQVKAGKSSLINSLTGAQQATVDVLPSTRAVQRYRLETLGESGAAERLTLLDTAGYGEAGASPDQFAETLQAVRSSDVVLVVMDSKSPAKQADGKVLDELAGWYRAQPQFKPPPTIGVVSKIDALSPLMEWQPPYDWVKPQRLKEESIAGAVNYVREQLGRHFEAVVPVCTDRSRNREYGLTEFLIPAMTALLTEARAVSLIKALHLEQDQGKFAKIAHQAISAGRQLLELWRQGSRT